MHDPEHTITATINKLETAGKRYGVGAIDWATIIAAIMALFKDCGKDAAKKYPLWSRIRLTGHLRNTMPGSTLKEIVAVRETVMVVATEATDDELEAFGELSL